MTLGLAITGISGQWVKTTIKEGNKALEETKNKIYTINTFGDLGTKQCFKKII